MFCQGTVIKWRTICFNSTAHTVVGVGGCLIARNIHINILTLHFHFAYYYIAVVFLSSLKLIFDNCIMQCFEDIF